MPPTAPNLLQLLLLLPFTLLYFSSMALIHEVGHILMGVVVGGKCQMALRLNGLTPNLTTRINLTTSIGPVSNALVTAAGIVLQLLVTLVYVLQDTIPEVRTLAFIYLAVVGINIAPIKPSDGYHLNLLAKQQWLERCPALMKALTDLQWGLFGTGILVATWYSIEALTRYSRTRGLWWIGLGIIGLVVVVRIITRISGLSLPSVGDD